MFWNFVLRAVQFRETPPAAGLRGAGCRGYAGDRALQRLLGYRAQDARRVPRIRREHRDRAGGRRADRPARRGGEAERQGAVAAPFIYTVGSLAGEPVVVAGTDFDARASADQLLACGWRARRGCRRMPGGQHRGRAFPPPSWGRQLELEGAPCMIRGIVSSGGTEDAQVILPL